MKFLCSLFKKKNVLTCSVCLTQIEHVNCSTLPCSHQFHTTCILQCKNVCPLCRKPILSTNDTNTNHNVTTFVDDYDVFDSQFDSQTVNYPLEGTEVNGQQQQLYVDPLTAYKQHLETLHSYENKSPIHGVIIQLFDQFLSFEDYKKAYQTRCCYAFGTPAYFECILRNAGVTRNNNIVFDKDVIELMDKICESQLTQQQMNTIKTNVQKLMGTYVFGDDYTMYDDKKTCDIENDIINENDINENENENVL